ncbi:hypothetical protein HDU96_006873 [Phlyctochytrium bullatum]|nr:hypothetical protein HDU96_006873 [Phlyctochytrium bullatum]
MSDDRDPLLHSPPQLAFDDMDMDMDEETTMPPSYNNTEKKTLFRVVTLMGAEQQDPATTRSMLRWMRVFTWIRLMGESSPGVHLFLANPSIPSQQIVPLAFILALFTLSEPAPPSPDAPAAPTSGSFAALLHDPTALAAHYPPAKRVNVTDDIHGVPVRDPYRWLEDPFDPEVLDFVAAQDKLAGRVRELRGYSKFKKAFYDTVAFDRFTSPLYLRGWWFYYANFGGLNNQNVLYRARNLSDTKPEVFLDPNQLSPNGVDQVDGFSFSPDGERFAFLSTKNETDYGYIAFLNTTTGTPIDTRLRFIVRYLGSPAFEWQRTGVLYTRYPAPANLSWTDAGRNNDAFPLSARRAFHRFGTSQSEDLDCGPAYVDPRLPTQPKLPPACRPAAVRRAEEEAARVVRRETEEEKEEEEECEEWEIVRETPKAKPKTYLEDRVASVVPRGGGDVSALASAPSILLRATHRDLSTPPTFHRQPSSLFTAATPFDAIHDAEVLTVLGGREIDWKAEGMPVGQVDMRGRDGEWGGGEGRGVMTLYKTAVGAGRGRVVGVVEGEEGVKAYEVLPEHERWVLDDVKVVSKEEGYVFVTYLDDVTHRIRIFTNFTAEAGGQLHDELPLQGGACSRVLPSKLQDASLTGTANATTTVVSFGYESLLDPGAIYMYYPATKRLEVLWKMTAPTGPVGRHGGGAKGKPEVEQVFFRSKDGTVDVPMWVARGAGVPRIGARDEAPNTTEDDDEEEKTGRLAPRGFPRPKPPRRHPRPAHPPATIWMTGYGGFLVSRLPVFTPLALALVRASPTSAFVLVNVRGGGEYGTAWYDAGRNLNKMNVFEDYVSAARELVARGVTRPGRLGIQGASNGGLMASAVSLMAPELFSAAIVDVGVHDIARYERFTFGYGWVLDYGHADNATEAVARLAWSPVQRVHRMENGTYPFANTLVSTGDHDTRVSPMHSYKLAAAMQFVAGSGGAKEGGRAGGVGAVLLRVRELSGHNIFSTTRLAEAWSEKVAFWAHVVGAHGLE